MKIRQNVFPPQDLIVVDAAGPLDLPGSKVALRKLAADPRFDPDMEVLIDLRDVACEMSTLDIYELARDLTSSDPALPTRRKIAVLVSGRSEFDHALFLQTSTATAGIPVAPVDESRARCYGLNSALTRDPIATA